MKKWGIAVMGLLLCFAACKQEAGKEEVPGQELEQEAVLTDGEWETAGLSQSADVKAMGLTNGKVMENLVTVGEDHPYYCNLEENIRGDREEYRVLVCKDPVYDITYFVNYGKDYYIYAIRDGKTELAVELPASELYCREGELYFMIEPYGMYQLSGLEYGNIVKYNPKDGTVEMVLEEETRAMIVYPDGICYDIHEDVKRTGENSWSYIVKRYFYSFETGQTTKFENLRRHRERWRDYWLFNEKEGGMSLENQKGEKVCLLKNLETIPEPRWMKGDSMYYLEKNVLMKYCFVTEENTVLADLALKPYGCDFLIYNNVGYFGNRLSISFEEEVQYSVTIKDRAAGEGYFIDAFYSDGEALYCLNSGRLWRMTEERNDEEARQLLVNEQLVTFGCYEYTLHPLDTK